MPFDGKQHGNWSWQPARRKKRHVVLHLKILIPCVRAILGEFLHAVEADQITAKHWLGPPNRVWKLTTNKRARKIAIKHQIDCAEILALANNHEKLESENSSISEPPIETSIQKRKAFFRVIDGVFSFASQSNYFRRIKSAM